MKNAPPHIRFPTPPFIAFVAVLALVILGGILTGCSSVQSAGPGSDDVSWTLPTQNVDGSALPAAQIVSVTINQYAGLTGGAVISSQTLPGAATAATFPRTGTGVGTFCYDGMVLTTLPSALSTPRVCKTITAAPNTIAGMTVK